MSASKKAARARDSALERAVELEATIQRLEIQSASDRAELTVADATIDACRARIARLEHIRENLTQRIAMTERERDSRPLTVVEPEVVVTSVPDDVLEASRVASDSLAHIAAERDGALSELRGALEAIASSSLERDVLLEELRATRESEAKRSAERDESDRRRTVIEDAWERRVAEFVRERDVLIHEMQTNAERLSSFAKERTAFGQQIAALEARIASLSSARERLFEGNARATEARLAAERLTAEREAEIDRLRKDIDERSERAALDSVLQSEEIKRLEKQRAKLEYERESSAARTATLNDELERFKSRTTQRESALEDAEATIAANAEIMQALALAQRQAAGSLAALELTRLRLEYDLAVRVSAAESETARTAVAASRLREDRDMLVETIALRERRIAALESTLREVARDLIRTAETERERYVEMHRMLLASKIVKIRDVVAALLSRPLGLRARFFPAPFRTVGKRRAPRTGDKRPRHLRSA